MVLSSASVRQEGWQNLFIEPNEDLIKALGWTNVTTAYRDQVPSASIRSTVNSTINAGVALVNYVGHSDYNFWGGYETVYATADMDSLANAGKPTVVMQWGCWNNYYVNSKNTTMSHRFLVTGPTGAAGVFGSATRSSAQSEAELSKRLAVYLAQPELTLGEAILKATQELARTNPGMRDVIIGMTYLGDPTMKLGR